MMDDELKKIIKQNDTIISLLGRIAFRPEEIRNIVTFKKRTPENYLKGYNSCDGNNSVSVIADIIGVHVSTLSPILSEWEQVGIIYEVEKPGAKFYKKILSI